MRIAALLALGLVLVVIGIEIARFVKDGGAAREALFRAEDTLSEVKRESAELEANLRYFRRPENLEKEMRARFNYRGVGEKLLILVPEEASSTATSSANAPQ
jgi:hypothetical protein